MIPGRVSASPRFLSRECFQHTPEEYAGLNDTSPRRTRPCWLGVLWCGRPGGGVYGKVVRCQVFLTIFVIAGVVTTFTTPSQSGLERLSIERFTVLHHCQFDQHLDYLFCICSGIISARFERHFATKHSSLLHSHHTYLRCSDRAWQTLHFPSEQLPLGYLATTLQPGEVMRGKQSPRFVETWPESS